MEEVLNNLQSIKDFRVLSRTSTDQYKDPDRPTITEIAKKLNVNYVVEGSGQKYGNKFRLRVQLIRAKGKETHIWGKSYEKEIRETNDIFSIQSQIAEAIATELKATIVPEEKQLIEKTSATNLTAYDFYTRGREELKKYRSDNNNKLSLRKAEDLYHKALENDPAFAPAYIGLAYVYWTKHGNEEYFSRNYLDSVLFLCNKALSFDNQLSEAYTLRGSYYEEVGKAEQAIKEFDKAIKLNPNDWAAYWNTGGYYSWAYIDLVKSIYNLQKAASLNHGLELPAILKGVSDVYCHAGFPEKAKYYCQEKLKLDDDSCAYYSSLSDFEFWFANHNKAIEFGVKVYSIDSTNEGIFYKLGIAYARLGQYEEALKYYKKYIERLKTQGRLSEIDGINVGYVYWQNGKKEEAEYYFKFAQTKDLIRANELKRLGSVARYNYYDLATIFAFRGEKDEAFRNLRIFNQIQRVPLWIATSIKNIPLFDSIRSEPEFQQIVKEVETKYQAEHERVRKWIEEQGK